MTKRKTRQPNLQNIPINLPASKRIKLFPERHVFAKVDFSAFERRMLRIMTRKSSRR